MFLVAAFPEISLNIKNLPPLGAEGKVIVIVPVPLASTG
jgi:hypothetical protein